MELSPIEVKPAFLIDKIHTMSYICVGESEFFTTFNWLHNVPRQTAITILGQFPNTDVALLRISQRVGHTIIITWKLAGDDSCQHICFTVRNGKLRDGEREVTFRDLWKNHGIWGEAAHPTFVAHPAAHPTGYMYRIVQKVWLQQRKREVSSTVYEELYVEMQKIQTIEVQMASLSSERDTLDEKVRELSAKLRSISGATRMMQLTAKVEPCDRTQYTHTT